jgi:hypothetical protein
MLAGRPPGAEISRPALPSGGSGDDERACVHRLLTTFGQKIKGRHRYGARRMTGERTK